MSGNAGYVPTFESDLGDRLFPGEEYSDRELNSLVGEVLSHCNALGKPHDLNGIGFVLGVMIPEFVKCDTDPVWLERSQTRWEQELKPQLISKFESYFIDGGLEQEQAMTAECLFRMQTVGIEIEGKGILSTDLEQGDWRKKLIIWGMSGRPKGVCFLIQSDFDPEPLIKLLRLYGFENDAINKFISGCLRVKN